MFGVLKDIAALVEKKITYHLIYIVILPALDVIVEPTAAILVDDIDVTEDALAEISQHCGEFCKLFAPIAKISISSMYYNARKPLYIDFKSQQNDCFYF